MKLRNPLRKFPVRVLIWEKRANTVFPCWDKARRHRTPDGEYYYELKRKKIDTKPTKYDFVYLSSNGLLLNMYSPSPYEFHPVTFKEVEEKLIPTVDSFYINWLVNENKRAVAKWRKKSSWDFILPIIPIVIVGIVAALMLSITTEKFTEMAGTMASIGNNLEKVAVTLVDAIKAINPNYQPTYNTTSSPIATQPPPR